FVLPAPWGIVAIIGAGVLELGESWFWIRFTKRRRSVTGAEGLVGQTAVVVEACRPDGRVRVHGELWRAHCPRGAEVGEHVRVAGRGRRPKVGGERRPGLKPGSAGTVFSGGAARPGGGPAEGEAPGGWVEVSPKPVSSPSPDARTPACTR